MSRSEPTLSLQQEMRSTYGIKQMAQTAIMENQTLRALFGAFEGLIKDNTQFCSARKTPQSPSFPRKPRQRRPMTLEPGSLPPRVITKSSAPNYSLIDARRHIEWT